MPDETTDDQVLDTEGGDYSASDVVDEGAAAMAAAESATEDADASAAEVDKSDAEGDDDAESKATQLSDEDKRFLELKELGVSPADLVSYARKGYAAEHEDPPAKKETPKPAESATEDDDYLPVTKKELRQTLKQFAQEAAGSIAGATADATVEQLLDTSDHADDDTSRGMIKSKAWSLIKAGTKPRAAFKQALKLHQDWIAKQVASTNQRKVKAKRTAGTSSAGLASSPLEDLDLVHREDDFQTGKAHDDAVDFMRKADKLA